MSSAQEQSTNLETKLLEQQEYTRTSSELIERLQEEIQQEKAQHESTASLLQMSANEHRQAVTQQAADLARAKEEAVQYKQEFMSAQETIAGLQEATRSSTAEMKQENEQLAASLEEHKKAVSVYHNNEQILKAQLAERQQPPAQDAIAAATEPLKAAIEASAQALAAERQKVADAAQAVDAVNAEFVQFRASASETETSRTLHAEELSSKLVAATEERDEARGDAAQLTDLVEGLKQDRGMLCAKNEELEVSATRADELEKALIERTDEVEGLRVDRGVLATRVDELEVAAAHLVEVEQALAEQTARCSQAEEAAKQLGDQGQSHAENLQAELQHAKETIANLKDAATKHPDEVQAAVDAAMAPLQEQIVNDGKEKAAEHQNQLAAAAADLLAAQSTAKEMETARLQAERAIGDLKLAAQGDASQVQAAADKATEAAQTASAARDQVQAELEQERSAYAALAERLSEVQAASVSDSALVEEKSSELAVCKSELDAARNELAALGEKNQQAVEESSNELQAAITQHMEQMEGMDAKLTAAQGTAATEKAACDEVHSTLAAVQRNMAVLVEEKQTLAASLEQCKESLEEHQKAVTIHNGNEEHLKAKLAESQDGSSHDLQAAIAQHTEQMEGMKAELAAAQGTASAEKAACEAVQLTLTAAQEQTTGIAQQLERAQYDLKQTAEFLEASQAGQKAQSLQLEKYDNQFTLTKDALSACQSELAGVKSELGVSNKTLSALQDTAGEMGPLQSQLLSAEQAASEFKEQVAHQLVLRQREQARHQETVIALETAQAELQEVASRADTAGASSQLQLTQISTLEAHASAAQQDADNAKAHASELLQHVDVHKETISELEKVIQESVKNHTVALESLQDRLLAAEQDVMLAKTTSEDSELRITLLTTQLNDSQNVRKSSEEKLIAVEEDLHVAGAKLQALQGDHDSTVEKAAADTEEAIEAAAKPLRAQVQASASELETEIALRTETERAFEAARNEYDSLTQEKDASMQQYATQLDQVTRQLESAKSEHESLRTDIQESEQTISELRAHLDAQPDEIQAAVEGAVAPLREEMKASADELRQEKDEHGKTRTAMEAVRADYDNAQKMIQASQEGSSAQVEEYTKQLALGKEAASVLHAELQHAQREVAALQSTAEKQPGAVDAAVAAAVGVASTSLNEQLKLSADALEQELNQHAETRGDLNALQRDYGKSQHAIRALEDGIKSQIEEYETQLGASKEQAADLQLKLQAAENSVSGLQNAVDGQADMAQAAVDAAIGAVVSPLEARIQASNDALQTQQQEYERRLALSKEAAAVLHSQMQRANEHATGLEKEAATYPDRVQAAIGAAVGPLHAQVQDLSDMLEEEKADHKTTRDGATALRTDLEAVQVAIAAGQEARTEEFKSLEEAVKSSRSQASALALQLKQTQDDRTALNEVVSNHTEEVAAAVKPLQDRFDIVSQQLDHEKKEHAEARSALTCMRSDYANVQKLIKASQDGNISQIEEYKQQLESSKGEAALLQSQLHQAVEALFKAEEALQQAESSDQEHKQQVDIYAKQAQQNKVDAAELQTQLEQATDSIVALQQQVYNQPKEISAALEAAVAPLQVQLKSSEEVLEEERNQHAQARATLDNLRKDYAQTQQVVKTSEGSTETMAKQYEKQFALNKETIEMLQSQLREAAAAIADLQQASDNQPAAIMTAVESATRSLRIQVQASLDALDKERTLQSATRDAADVFRADLEAAQVALAASQDARANETQSWREALEGSKGQVTALQLQLQQIQDALTMLKQDATEHPEKVATAVGTAMQPLQEQLETSRQECARATSQYKELQVAFDGLQTEYRNSQMISAASEDNFAVKASAYATALQDSKNEAVTLQSQLQQAVKSIGVLQQAANCYPDEIQAAVEGAVAPLREEMKASADELRQEKDEHGKTRTAMEAVRADYDNAQKMIQASQEGSSAQVEEYTKQLALGKEAASVLHAELQHAQREVAALQSTAEKQPGAVDAAVAAAVDVASTSLNEQLKLSADALEQELNQHAETRGDLNALQRDYGKSQHAIRALEDGIKSQIEEYETQLGASKEQAADLQLKLQAAENSVSGLQNAVDGQADMAQAAVDAAIDAVVSPLEARNQASVMALQAEKARHAEARAAVDVLRTDLLKAQQALALNEQQGTSAQSGQNERTKKEMLLLKTRAQQADAAVIKLEKSLARSGHKLKIALAESGEATELLSACRSGMQQQQVQIERYSAEVKSLQSKLQAATDQSAPHPEPGTDHATTQPGGLSGEDTHVQHNPTSPASKSKIPILAKQMLVSGTKPADAQSVANQKGQGSEESSVPRGQKTGQLQAEIALVKSQLVAAAANAEGARSALQQERAQHERTASELQRISSGPQIKQQQNSTQAKHGAPHTSTALAETEALLAQTAHQLVEERSKVHALQENGQRSFREMHAALESQIKSFQDHKANLEGELKKPKIKWKQRMRT